MTRTALDHSVISGSNSARGTDVQDLSVLFSRPCGYARRATMCL